MRFKKSDAMYQLESKINRELPGLEYQVEEGQDASGAFNVIGFSVSLVANGDRFFIEDEDDLSVAKDWVAAA